MPRALAIALVLAGCGDGSPQPDAGVPDLAVADLALPQAALLAPAQTLTTCLAVASGGVFWIESDGRVMRVPVQGGAAPSEIASGADKSGCLVADADGVYFTASTGGYADLRRAPLSGGDGGTGALLAPAQHALPESKAFLAVEGGFLYFATDVYGPADASFSGKSAIARVATGGGTVEIVYSEVVGDPGGLAVDASTWFYSDSNGTFAVPRSGGAALPLGMSVIKRNAFAAGTSLIAIAEVTAIGMGDVAVMRKDGQQRRVLLDRLITPLALDDANVFVNLDGHLTRLPVDGLSAQPLSAQQARAVAVDATAVYFTDGASILKVAR